MDESSTTPGDNPSGDAAADSTTASDPNTGTDTSQPADNGDNLDPSKSPETTSADGDKPADGSTPSDGGTPSSTFDDDLDQWIEKRGLAKPESDEQKQAYQDLRNSQREFTREQQAKKDAENLGKTMEDAKKDALPEDEDEDDEDDPAEARIRKLEEKAETERVARLQSEFYASANDGKPITPEQNEAIMAIFKEKVSRPTTQEGKKAAFDIWSNPDALPDLLELAKARLANSVDPAAEREKAAQEERERIAKESQASSAGRGAKSTTTNDGETDDERRLNLWRSDKPGSK